ncbi:MAG: uroporphyrinogen decarboxylase family protein, partial [Candidatus Saccharicenans sp.]
PHRPELYAESARVISEFKPDYWIVGAVLATIFETAWALRGLEQTLLDMVSKPELIERLFDIPFHYHLEVAKKLVEMGVDMIWLGDDVGGQDRMIISPARWRRYLKPRMAEFISALKSINPKLKIAYHSDGFVYPIIPDLIQIGLDVLNPVQPRSMDPEQLKKLYGEKLCFWGTIDLQFTLPFGRPEEVSREVITRLKTVGKNGGLIIGPTHHLPLDTPLENFWAMINTIKETPYSRLK